MAGSRIKGITVEIGGDTTKLQTALKGVNQQNPPKREIHRLALHQQAGAHRPGMSCQNRQ